MGEGLFHFGSEDDADLTEPQILDAVLDDRVSERDEKRDAGGLATE